MAGKTRVLTAATDDVIWPWEQQQGESDDAFTVFSAYRDMPAGKRSLRELARTVAAERNRNEHTTFSVLAGYSSKWGWVDRCRAWDRECDRQARDVVTQRHRRSIERSLSALVQPVDIVLAITDPDSAKNLPYFIRQLADRARSDILTGAGGMDAYLAIMQTLARTSAAMASQITGERLVYGMSTENVAEQSGSSSGAVESAANDPAFVADIRNALLRAAGLPVQPRRDGMGRHGR